MPDVSIYVAVISACAGVAGAAVPQYATLRRDARRAEYDRRERRSELKRQACIDLLSAAGELRALVANAASCHGADMDVRLTQVRECAEAVQLHAASVQLLAAGALTEPAEQLAAAAGHLAAMAVENTDTKLQQMTSKPDFTAFNESVAAFRLIAVADTARGPQ